MDQCVQIIGGYYGAVASDAPTPFTLHFGASRESCTPALPRATLTLVVCRGEGFESRLAEISHTLPEGDTLLVFHDDTHPLVTGLEKAQLFIAQARVLQLWVIDTLGLSNGETTLWHLLLAAQDETADKAFAARWARGPFVAMSTREKTTLEEAMSFPALDKNSDALLWRWLTTDARPDLRFTEGKTLRLFAKNSLLPLSNFGTI